MIIGYFGNVRQGKTLSAVRELKKFYDEGYHIFSNTWLSFDFTPLELDYILDIVEKGIDVPDKSVFFIDEIYIWQDSRVSGSKRNRIISYFLLQTGKLGESTDYGLILLFTAQYPDQIDKRLRHVMDIAVLCEKISLKGEKYFKLIKYFFRGDKSYSSGKVYRATSDDYALYDTRKRITMVKDRYYEE